MQVVLENTTADVFSYRMDTRVKRGLIRPHILQRSEFTWKNGIVLPTSFQSTQKLSFYKRSEFVDFNWEKMKATGRKKRVDFEMDIHPGMQDKLTIYLFLAHELCKGGYSIEADIVSGPILKTYSYHFQAKQSLQTKLGALETIHIRRGTPEEQKQTDLWHAVGVGLLPVKLVYRNKNDVTTMNLNSISFSEQP